MRNLKFENRTQLEGWLQTQPGEVAVAIGSRAALRVLPLLYDESHRYPAAAVFTRLVAIVFRANAVARAIVKYPRYVNELRPADIAAAAAASGYSSGWNVARDVAASAEKAVAASSFVRLIPAAIPLVIDAIAHAEATPLALSVWSEVLFDAQFVADGGTAALLADRRLWVHETPDWVARKLETLLSALPRGEDWEVWIQWYRDRLEGAETSEADEIVFVDSPLLGWEVDLAATNRSISTRLSQLNLVSEHPNSYARPPLQFENHQQFAKWVQLNPRETSEVCAVRAALRILPLVDRARPARGDKISIASYLRTVSDALRATAFAWTAAKYPGRAGELHRFARDAASAASRVSSSMIDLGNIPANYVGQAIEFVSNLAAQPAAQFIHDASAIQAAVSLAVSDDVAVWSAVSADVRYLEDGGSVVSLIDRPLWPGDPPPWAQINWAAITSSLPSDENWEVWRRWFEDRLSGVGRSEATEILYATVPSDLWNREQGWVEANRWIAEKLSRQKWSLGELARADDSKMPLSELPRPILDISSPFSFGWTNAARISIVAGPQNTAVLPFHTSECDHKNALETSRTLFERLCAELESGQFNVRSHYARSVKAYLNDLPMRPGAGNILLADAEARILREMFEAEASILPAAFTARLKTALQQHIGLRAFYPEVERFYNSVLGGRLEAPLPQDAVVAFLEAVRANTPTTFEPNVIKGLAQVEHTPPLIELDPEDKRESSDHIAPQLDPLGHLEPRKSRSYSIASAANSLWAAFLKGKDLPEAIAGWSQVATQMAPHAQKIIEWLEKFLNSGH